MCPTCKYVGRMKMLQVRHVPDDVHRTLKARAAQAGQSLSEYALGELRRAAERPSRQELADRVRQRSAATDQEGSVEAVRAERDRP